MSSTKVFTLGLSKIEVATVETAVSPAQLGYTYQDTAVLEQADPNETEHYAEEVDDPVVVIRRAGTTTVRFSIMNPDVDVLAQIMGGTASTTSGESWEAPDKVPNIEKALIITPEQGFKIEIPRASIFAKINGNFSKTGIMLVDVTAKVLQPTTSGKKKMKLTKLTA